MPHGWHSLYIQESMHNRPQLSIHACFMQYFLNIEAMPVYPWNGVTMTGTLSQNTSLLRGSNVTHTLSAV